MNKTILKDALHNTSASVDPNHEYARGVTLGIITGLMATLGVSYEEAVRLVKECIPKDAIPECKFWEV